LLAKTEVRTGSQLARVALERYRDLSMIRSTTAALSHRRNGRHEETRTPDLYRVNFEVNKPQPFARLTLLDSA
jgi:hypothetical protein